MSDPHSPVVIRMPPVKVGKPPIKVGKPPVNLKPPFGTLDRKD
jgi:hypothetical protein